MSVVTVIGVGRLGLCFTLLLELAGYKVHAVDTNSAHIKTLREKTFQTSEPKVSNLLQNQKNITWWTELTPESVNDSSVIFILADTSYLSAQVPYNCCHVDSILKSLVDFVTGKHIVINSTVFPQYCNSKVSSLPVECTLSYSPEFIAQGDIINGLLEPDMVLIGSNSDIALTILSEIYSNICINKPPICTMTLTEAEITKLAVNTFLTMKISYANYIGDLADAVGANSEVILDAVGEDSRIGGKYLRPGFGYGGPCLVRDNDALSSFADQVSIPSIIGHTTDAYNNYHTKHMIKKLLLEDAQPYAFNGSVTYKYGSIMLENSQQLVTAKAMLEAGKNIYVDNSKEVCDVLRQDPLMIERVHQITYKS